ARGMPHDDRVGPHRLQGERRVLQRLALRDARSTGPEVDHVRRQPLRRELEADPCAGRVLEEEVDDGAPAQRRHLLDHPGADLPERSRRVQDPRDVVPRKVVHRQQMFVHAPPSPSSDRRTVTASAPSSSWTWTRTLSSRLVGTFLPTKSARIGSSRCPRSTRTASWILCGRPRSMSASIAERIVRPVYNTSSTSTTTLPETSNPIRVSCTSGASARSPMSSR